MGFSFGIVKLCENIFVLEVIKPRCKFTATFFCCAVRAAACTLAAFAIGVPSTRRCAGMLSFVIHQRARLTQYSYCHQARIWSRDGGKGEIRENNNDGTNREDITGGWLRPS